MTEAEGELKPGTSFSQGRKSVQALPASGWTEPGRVFAGIGKRGLSINYADVKVFVPLPY